MQFFKIRKAERRKACISTGADTEGAQFPLDLDVAKFYISEAIDAGRKVSSKFYLTNLVP